MSEIPPLPRYPDHPEFNVQEFFFHEHRPLVARVASAEDNTRFLGLQIEEVNEALFHQKLVAEETTDDLALLKLLNEELNERVKRLEARLPDESVVIRLVPPTCPPRLAERPGGPGVLNRAVRWLSQWLSTTKPNTSR
jgi:hypothetical protein